MEEQKQPNMEIPTPPVVEQNNTPNPPAVTTQYAGFWIRFLAVIIDGVILSIIGSLFGSTQVIDGMVSVNFFGWKMIIPLAYYLGFWIWKSATPGKMALGLKIVDEKHENINVPQVFIRYFSMILSALPLFLGYIWASFEPKKRAWHDMLAKTYVIKTK